MKSPITWIAGSSIIIIIIAGIISSYIAISENKLEVNLNNINAVIQTTNTSFEIEGIYEKIKIPREKPLAIIYNLVERNAISSTTADIILKNLDRITWNPNTCQFTDLKKRKHQENKQKAWLTRNSHLMEIENTQSKDKSE
jgi:hypothetical protein